LSVETPEQLLEHRYGKYRRLGEWQAEGLETAQMAP
jgi:hypothetical protein